MIENFVEFLEKIFTLQFFSVRYEEFPWISTFKYFSNDTVNEHTIRDIPVRIYFPDCTTFSGVNLPPIADPLSCRQILPPLIQWAQMSYYGYLANPATVLDAPDCQKGNLQNVIRNEKYKGLRPDHARSKKVVTREFINAFAEWALFHNGPTYMDGAVLWQILTMNDIDRICNTFPVSAQACEAFCNACEKRVSTLDIHEAHLSLVFLAFAYYLLHIAETRQEVRKNIFLFQKTLFQNFHCKTFCRLPNIFTLK